MQLLFESRPEIANLDGKLRWVQQHPRIHEVPVLGPSHSGDGAGCSIYGSVLFDQGMYRMWYQGWPRDWNGGNSCIVCYAESDDGVSWRKPELNLDDRFDTPNGVTDLGMHAPAVFMDPAAPSSHRYRATGCASSSYAGANRAITVTGYYTAHSSDGLHWTLDSDAPTWPGGDVITSVYHPVQERALVALKRNVRVGGIRRRAIWNARFAEGVWHPDDCALVPDSYDDTAAITRGFASGDYYGMAMQPAGSGTAGFIWHFRHALPRTLQGTAGDGAGVFGVVDVGLAYQPSAGSAWLHAAGRPDFISNRDIPWKPNGCVYTAAAPTAFGDEHRLYLCATNAHGWYVGSDWQVHEKTLRKVIDRGLSSIGYAAWPAWRLFGYRGEPEGKLTLDLGLLSEPVQLRLNYETHNQAGSVRCAVRDDSRRQVGGCRPLTGQSIGTAVQWQGGSRICPRRNGATVVDIHLEEATVWAWEICPDS